MRALTQPLNTYVFTAMITAIGIGSGPLWGPSKAYAQTTADDGVCNTAQASESVKALHDTFVALHRARLPGPQGAERLQRELIRLATEHSNLERFANEVLVGLEASSPEQGQAWRESLIETVKTRYLTRLEDLETGVVEVASTRGDCKGLLLQLRLGRKQRPAMVRLEHGPKGWLAYDFGLDDISLRDLWRQRLQKAYREDGAQGLQRHLERLRQSPMR